MVRLSETLDSLGFHQLSDKITPIIWQTWTLSV
jgi:hypothetical protein